MQFVFLWKFFKTFIENLFQPKLYLLAVVHILIHFFFCIKRVCVPQIIIFFYIKRNEQMIGAGIECNILNVLNSET